MSQSAIPTDPPTYEYDVFISYSRQDKAWVLGELAPRLQKAGLKTCIDIDDFRAGAPAIKEIRRAIKTSRKTLLVLSPNYLESKWTELERYLPQTKDPLNEELRIIPFLYESCNLPEDIAYLSYIDFTDDVDLAWRQLFRAFGIDLTAKQAKANQPKQWLLAHPYAMPPHFTGRVAERQMLSQWLNEDTQHPLMVLRALGGFGKSALTWHWLLNDVDKRRWPRVVWWSFYEAQAEFDNFVATTLGYLMRRGPKEVVKELKPRERVGALLNCLQQPGTLLVLDGYERELRAYSNMGAAYQGDGEATVADEGRDCVNPDADDFFRKLCSLPNLQSKVLMSTRLRPRSMEVTGGMLLAGCKEEELTQMQPADAVALFRALGIRGNRNEIEQACGAYGFHPLSLRLLAGLVVNDFYNPGDIQAAQALDVSGELVQRQHHVLEQSYLNLSPLGQKFLSQIACFRSPVEIRILIKIGQPPEIETTPPKQPGFLRRVTSLFSSKQATKSAENNNIQNIQQALEKNVQDLMDRGLVQREGPRFDLHPIVRRYAYDRMTDQARSSTHSQLRDYFAAVPTVDKVTTLDDLAPTIELYHHIVRAGQYDRACDLFHNRLDQATYYQLGAYQLQIELLRALFPQGEAHPPQLSSEGDQAWTLNSLANSYSLSGKPAKAIPLFEQGIAITEKTDDKRNLTIELGNLAHMAQVHIGALQAAEANLTRSIALCQELEDKFLEAVGHKELGRVRAYRGDWAGATAALDRALELNEKDNVIQGQAITWAYRALQALLAVRNIENAETGQNEQAQIEAALAAGRRSLELADEDARTDYPVPRDYVRAHWLLGTALRLQPNLPDSEHHLTTALHHCRAINMVDHEADILLDLARLRRDQGNAAEAHRLAQEALIITNRSGYVLQGADINLFLAEQALVEGDEAKARAYASTARELATCDGGEYTYKVAYEEAGALLAKLGSA
ncbi:MAG: TIR domain-containing protein [Cyanobacteria bacterium P01_D01_bin.105]